MRTADVPYEKSVRKTPLPTSRYPRSVPKSTFFPNSEQDGADLPTILPLRPLEQRPHQAHRRRSLERALPEVLGHLFVQANASGAEVIIATPTRILGCSPS